MTPDSRTFAARIRAHALRMTSRANASHIGTALSMADILAVLYTDILRIDPANPVWHDRDRFILSKGHGTTTLFASLAERGFFPLDWLDTYGQDGTKLAGHIVHSGVPGVEMSTGSLGHGLPVACGMALAARHEKSGRRVFCLLSDGELDEGSNWEAILFAPHHKLDNVIAIVDYNKIQSFGSVREVLDLEPLIDKWKAFKWCVAEIDGHDHASIHAVLSTAPLEPGKPTVVIAHTVKGKGVSFMENQLAWHYKSANADQLAQALGEIEPTQEEPTP